MTLRFTKMHGLGNDFMVIDAVRQSVHLTPKQISQLACRHTGIGFDQCLLIEPSHQDHIDFFYRIYNADGSEVGQCGNGARCLARFVTHYELTHKKNITIATHSTQMSLHINKDDTVTVDMGQPHYHSISSSILLNGHHYTFQEIDVGNPHAVLICDDVEQAPVDTIGKQLSQHPHFPNQCNIGFMQILAPDHIKLRVYERGCGETLACGSGAVAAMAIGTLFHGLEQKVTVSLPGGTLSIQWSNSTSPIFLTGPASFVFEGVIVGNWLHG